MLLVLTQVLMVLLEASARLRRRQVWPGLAWQEAALAGPQRQVAEHCPVRDSSVAAAGSSRRGLTSARMHARAGC